MPAEAQNTPVAAMNPRRVGNDRLMRPPIHAIARRLTQPPADAAHDYASPARAERPLKRAPELPSRRSVHPRGREEIALHGWLDIAGYRSGQGRYLLHAAHRPSFLRFPDIVTLIGRRANVWANLPANLSTAREPLHGLPDALADPCASTSIAPAQHGEGSVIPPCRMRFMSGFKGVTPGFSAYPQSRRSPQDIASAKEPSTSS